MTEPMTRHARRRIYLMRHGNVTYFDANGKPLPPDTVPLNEQGRRQATAAGQVFAQAAVRFDRVIVSGLPRTVQTAQHVLAETGQQIELETWPELEELKGGKLELPAGKSFCLYALQSAIPLLPAKQRPLHPNDWMQTDSRVVCPDPLCGVIMLIQRQAPRTLKHSEVSAVELNNPDSEDS